MNVLSLFDGMSCGRIALKRAGIEVDQYFASEIDKYAIRISKKNWKDVIHLGDIQNWKSWNIDWKSIDLLIGGSPCQSFSNAGNKVAFDDQRGKLFFIYVEILEYIRERNPKVQFLLENVKMKKQFRDVISNTLGAEPVEINSSLVSALTRKRYYWSNFMQSEIVFADQLQECPYCYELFCPVHQQHFAECACVGPSEDEDIVEFKNGLVYRLPTDKSILLKDIMEPGSESLPWLSEKAINRLSCINKRAKENGLGYKDCILTENDKYLNLDANFAKGPDGKRGVIMQSNRLRMPSVLEAERLQTVPDGYTDGVSNSQRYKMLGNGWTVDVIAYIFKSLKGT